MLAKVLATIFVNLICVSAPFVLFGLLPLKKYYEGTTGLQQAASGMTLLWLIISGFSFSIWLCGKIWSDGDAST